MFANAILAIRTTELWSTPTVIASVGLAVITALVVARVLFVVTSSYDREP